MPDPNQPRSTQARVLLRQSTSARAGSRRRGVLGHRRSAGEGSALGPVRRPRARPRGPANVSPREVLRLPDGVGADLLVVGEAGICAADDGVGRARPPRAAPRGRARSALVPRADDAAVAHARLRGQLAFHVSGYTLRPSARTVEGSATGRRIRRGQADRRHGSEQPSLSACAVRAGSPK
jgi:hypothetical protein